MKLRQKFFIIAMLCFTSICLAQNERVLDGPFSFTLPDLNGVPTTFSYEQDGPNKGKLSVLLVFATWCSYCKQEVPQFQALWEKYQNNPKISFLALRTFRARETVKIEEFVKQYGITFPMVSDFPKEAPNYSATAKLWKLNYVPETFIYDENGKRIPFDLETTSQYYDVVDQIIQEYLAR